MKLKDIFSLNLNSKGGAKLFKKITNKYNLDYKDVRKSVEENTNKYGYYDISKIIRQSVGNYGEFKDIMGQLLIRANNIELTAIFLTHQTAGIFCYQKVNMALIFDINKIEDSIDSNNANVYIKVNENDMDYGMRDLDENRYKFNYKGTLIDRFISDGAQKEEVEQMLSPISKEEYERFVTEVGILLNE